MLIQPLNRVDPERVFISVHNVEASTITTGYGVNMAIGGNSFDGASATMAVSTSATNLPGFVGVAAADIPSNGYGLVQKYGFANSVFLSNTGTSVTINQGNPLVPGALPGGLTSSAPTYANGGSYFILAASNVPLAISAGGYISGFVRCL